MKSFFKLLILIIIFAGILSFVFYKSPLYSKYVNYQLSKSFLPKLQKQLEASYLYESSNLDRLSHRFGSEVMIKLKRRSAYNPQDTRKLFDDFIEYYFNAQNALSWLYYPMKTYEFKFYIKDTEEQGPVFIYKDGKITDNYANLREQIIKNDNQLKEQKEIEKEQQAKEAKEKRLAKKAFGFVNFGDPIEETKIKFERDPRVKIEELMISNPIYKVNLGSYSYNLEPIYKQDRLYMLNFVSHPYSVNQYNGAMKENWLDIIDYYKRLHGETKASFVPEEKLEAEFVEWTAHWKMDKKNIQVGLSKNNGKYYVVIWITHDDYQLDKL